LNFWQDPVSFLRNGNVILHRSHRLSVNLQEEKKVRCGVVTIVAAVLQQDWIIVFVDRNDPLLE
jgi:hypothetical protein